MPAERLSDEKVTFLTGMLGQTAVVMGAVKEIGDGFGEFKSMHISEAFRRLGLARSMLVALVDAARTRGLVRVSLETGSQPVFVQARPLYAAHEFTPCPPFADYTEDPNSFYMTRMLD